MKSLLVILAIINAILILLPIIYYIRVNKVKNNIIYFSFALILLYGFCESLSLVTNKIQFIYIGDTMLLLGSLFLYSSIIKIRKINIIPSNPTISILLIFTFLLGTTIINDLFQTPFFIISLIYYIGITTIAHIYELINDKGIQLSSSLLILSLIVCYIYDTLYFSRSLDISVYINAPWYVQYILQSLAGLILFFQLKYRKNK